MLHLRVIAKGGPGRAYALGPERPIVLGRSRQCDVVLRDPGISGRHCRFEVESGRLRVADLDSKNGIKVNGKRVKAAVCKPGDRLRVGETDLEIGDGEPSGAAATEVLASKVTAALLGTLPACAACGALVPARDVSAGRARRAGRFAFCPACPDPQLGRVVGGFRVLAELGQGAMGVVYRAHQESLDRVVALKVLLRAFTADEAAVQRFLREARAGSRCDHPGIVQVIDTGFDQGCHFLALEYVDGGSLADRLSVEPRLPLDEVQRIGRDVAGALAHAHARGVIHRDVKPGNLLVSRAGVVKVADLGLSKCLEESGLAALTQTGTTMGTLTYMPPEQLIDARSADSRSDVYSLGATCFHLATGARPYPGKSPRDYATQIREAPVDWKPAEAVGMPKAMRGALARAMAKDPKDRFQTMDQLAAALN